MMKYGTIAGNASINAAIYRCFTYLPEPEARHFVRRFAEQKQNNAQVMHTFRELILGGYLGSAGFRPTCTRLVEGKTPDWSLVGQKGDLAGVVELVNFHPAKAVEDQIMEHRDSGKMWVGRIGPHGPRLLDRLTEKAGIYKHLVDKADVPYVIAMFSEFTAAVDMDDVRPCLFAPETGIFHAYPAVSGFLLFEELSGTYHFTYTPNPHALRPLAIPSGVF